MDTGDTANNVDTGTNCPEETGAIISASEMAGEDGGFSCSTVSYSGFFSTIFVFIAVMKLRRHN